MTLMQANVQPRQTKYGDAVKIALTDCGHATNLEILTRIRISYPDLSATTVHRITARLSKRGEIGLAPSAAGGDLRYDANIRQHDHFHCVHCDRLLDIIVGGKLMPLLKSLREDCIVSGPFIVSGLCRQCFNNKEV